MSTHTQEDDDGLILEIDISVVYLFFTFVAIAASLCIWAGYALAEYFHQMF